MRLPAENSLADAAEIMLQSRIRNGNVSAGSDCTSRWIFPVSFIKSAMQSLVSASSPLRMLPKKSMENRKTAAQYKDTATVPIFPRKRSMSTQIIGASNAVTVNAETLSDLKIENSRMLKPSVNITEQSNAREKIPEALTTCAFGLLNMQFVFFSLLIIQLNHKFYNTKPV